MSGIMNLSNLTVVRGGQTLLSGLSCACNAGEVVVVLGPNGAGKSSLLLAMAGLIPAAGTITLSGQLLSAYDRREICRQIAWQGDLPPTEFGLTVRQRLLLAAGEADQGIEATAATMDIALLLQRPLGELSSGERQRVELAALMLRDTPVWLLDEPTAHLDLKHQIRCIQMLKAQSANGRAIITVLHDLQQAMAIADHLILIDGKGAAEYGKAAELFDGNRLSQLFDAPVIARGSVLIPDYGEER
ncbi:ABC transporter ATP-binding protein [Mariprofundus ferrooxydans]|uniref:ABC transporter ATP-binding protein n=1 Tax=Mariprofundus ferrooxydans TaxID=314344 RepID=UPI001430B894|nr:ABC transporter ATP-binding protein [Mariprofundus ferrooxydans]